MVSLGLKPCSTPYGAKTAPNSRNFLYETYETSKNTSNYASTKKSSSTFVFQLFQHWWRHGILKEMVFGHGHFPSDMAMFGFRWVSCWTNRRYHRIQPPISWDSLNLLQLQLHAKSSGLNPTGITISHQIRSSNPLPFIIFGITVSPHQIPSFPLW